MGGEVERRFSLPADPGSPARARRIVRELLHESGLPSMIDDAALLTSELCENAVIHAGTGFELGIRLSGSGLTVRVIDHGSSPFGIHRAMPPDTSATRGRGLLLVDRLAAAWGTRHDARGTEVWFTLRADTPADPGGDGAASTERRPPLESGPPGDGGPTVSWLSFLAEASELLAHPQDVELAAALVPQLAVPRLGEWCAVHLLDERGRLEIATLTHADESRLPALRAGLGAARGPLDGLLRGGSDVARLIAPGEAVAVAIVARGRALGTVTVGRPGNRPHTPEEVMVISDLARRAAPAIDNAQRNATNVATSQALQQALLPRALPTADAVEFAAAYLPASTGSDVGGDFYDVVAVGEDSWLVSVGDVCGKGAAAAARTSLVRDVLRVLVRDGRRPARALQLLNEMMLEANDPQQFATVVLAVVRPARGDGGTGLAVELVLAGHERPVLVRADGSTALVGRHGTAAGLVSEFTVHATSHVLLPGDALVGYTDGVTERRRGDEEFGEARLLDALGATAGSSATAIVAGLRRAVEGFSADPQRDDIAMIAVRAP